MVLYCIIIGLAVYYLALWGWYRRVAVNNRTVSQPERKSGKIPLRWWVKAASVVD